MWDLILNPFVTVLTFLYSVLNQDIVLAIIVFTILVRIAILPLTAQQQRSAKAMQELQPELKKLQDKYKNDREKLAQEQMALYREHGVNPLGGCLPLLIQFPILIGLYQAIIFTLAATPFQLIDLSNRFLIPGLDSYVPLNNMWLGMDLTKPPTANPTWALVLPALVLVTTWAQSKLTVPPPQPPGEDGRPSQAQAMSQSMTTIMPLMFGFFSLSFSVGLSIYFVVSNIIGIIQYSLMGKSKLNLGRLTGRGSDAAESPAPGKAKPNGKAEKLEPANNVEVVTNGSSRKQKKTKAKTRAERSK